MDSNFKSECLYTNVIFSSCPKNLIILTLQHLYNFTNVLVQQIFWTFILQFSHYISLLSVSSQMWVYSCDSVLFLSSKSNWLPHQESLILPHCHTVCWSPSSNCSSKGLCHSVAHSSLLSQPAQGLCDKSFSHSNYTAIYSMTGNSVSQ